MPLFSFCFMISLCGMSLNLKKILAMSIKINIITILNIQFNDVKYIHNIIMSPPLTSKTIFIL